MESSETTRRPLLCRLGWHDIYSDGETYIRHVPRCQICNQYTAPKRGEQLDLERELRDEARQVLTNPDSDSIEGYVRAHLFGHSIESYPPRPVWTQHEADLRASRADEAANVELQRRRKALGEQAYTDLRDDD